MKTKIKSAIFLASSVMLTVPALAMAQFDPTAGGGTNLPGQGGTLFGVIKNIMDWLLMIVGILGVIGFAIAGVLYLTSAGDETRIQTAKRAMLYSIIGIIVALAGMLAISVAQGLLGAQSGF